MSHRVEAVAGRRGLARFIDVPWHVFDRKRHRQWSPPLRAVVRDLLDTGKDPFYRSADVQLFVATDGGRPVGRIAAIENRAHNRRHGDRVGFFGFFDCVDDAAVARDLFGAAEGWLRERGLEVSRGPMNPSMNHECGLLVDGCDGETMVFTPWNPAYYHDLVAAAGYDKAKDLLAFDLPRGGGMDVAGRVSRLAERAQARAGLTFRDIDLKNLDDEARLVWPIYREAWDGNWGFVPPDWTEFHHLAVNLKPLMVPGFCFMAEVGGQPVGFMVIVKDFNQVFKKIPSGRLGPLAFWHLLVGSRKVKQGRVILFGLKEEARRSGLFPVFVHEIISRGIAVGAERAEASWVLEDNDALTSPLESMGFSAYRRWRIYDKPLGNGAPRP